MAVLRRAAIAAAFPGVSEATQHIATSQPHNSNAHWAALHPAKRSIVHEAADTWKGAITHLTFESYRRRISPFVTVQFQVFEFNEVISMNVDA